ncbi:premelanosome protein a [Rhinichthys klamathensis goyatoka]|uniref:premelanosome protein a n=1 Tax=Rhinichthys klamathensis goyatoka TaxID=3034132 RepID=UPI0024B5C2BD|nr:premelanosome protein a [Rhinichthys klamathensis goyatoka]
MHTAIMWTPLIFLVLTFSGALSQSRTRFAHYRSWNSKMYPVWRDGDPRYRDCWKGGEVTFKVRSDSPTLTGAKATFNIDVGFPQNQTALPDGQVVWARNCTINGTSYTMGQTVYPESNMPQQWTGVFPDRTPFNKTSNKKPRFIYVWKMLGKYWQVADGPSSLLTIETDNVPLGSYSMEVVIYHCRGKDKFIPLGYASTQFSITDQIPFAVTLSQVGDINQGDQSFIQNRAVSFSISVHDPSQYLSGSDISFNWDFGDNSGTLISRETTITHTYLSTGSFRPQVVLMAAISNGCQTNPTPAATVVPPVPVTDDATALESIVLTVSPQPDDVMPVAADVITVAANDLAVAADVVTVAANDLPVAADVITVAANDLPVAADVVTVAANDLSVAADVVTVAANDLPVAADVVTVAPNDLAVAADVITVAANDLPVAADVVTVAANDLPVAADVITVAANDLPVAADAITVAANDLAVAATDTAADLDNVAQEVAEDTAVASEAEPVADINLAVTVLPETPADVDDTTSVQTVIETVAPTGDATIIIITPEAVDEVVASVIPATQAITGVTSIPEAAVSEPEAEPVAGTVETQAALVIAKRQAPEIPAEANCVIYRYGSFSTTLTVIQGIESVEIVEVNNVVVMATELEQNAVDLTVTCQGSLPSQVCTVVSDADCTSPVQSLQCNDVTPTPECQIVLRQFFNNSGTFCINVSLTNDVSLAVTSAMLSVAIDTNSPRNTAGAILGVLVFICAVGAIAFTYRRFKEYHPLREDDTSSSLSSGRSSVSLMLLSLLSRRPTAESRPLLLGRVV